MRTKHRVGLWAVGIACAAGAVPNHAAECNLGKYADVPVTMMGSRPTVKATMNGTPIRLVADSGAVYSTLALASANKLALTLREPPPGFRSIGGVGGSQKAWFVKSKNFIVDGITPKALGNMEFLVTDTSISTYGGSDGLLGQNVLGTEDTEYDLANGIIRIFRAKDCGERSLAYWAGSKDVGIINLLKIPAAPAHIVGSATLNGKEIRVVFDTGADSSVLSFDAAARVGITPEEDGVAVGYSSGIGRKANATYLARFELLDLGGEHIQNARLRIADFGGLRMGADMLLGADFFLSHRVYVARSQKKVYFTYNGGRVFDLGAPAANPVTASQQPSVVSPAPSAALAKESLTAGEYKRRGAASAGRRDFPAAIGDFDAAIKLDSTDVETLEMRGNAQYQSGQLQLAMQDLDAVLRLKPDQASALMTRGTLRLATNDLPGANADFDRLTSLAPTDSSMTLRIALAYLSAMQNEEAFRRYDQWLAKNPKDSLTGSALTGRCWSRAMLGTQLELALDDCNAALKKLPNLSQVFDSRAMVQLRRGKLDEAIKDYQASLKILNNNAYTLYGLGVAETKKGNTAQGAEHIRQALQISSTAGDVFKQLNLAP